MKKKWLILICSTIFAGALALGACGEKKDGDYYGPSVEVGGSEDGGGETEVEIVGATDLHIGTNRTDVNAEIAKVQVYVGGVYDEVVANVDDIAFGQSGVYKIVYSYGEMRIEKNVYVYDKPTIADEKEGTVELTYAQAYTDLYDGISGKDSFGNSLGVQLLSDGGAYHEDGSLNVGEFTLEFAVMDRAGQTAKLSRTVSIGNMTDVFTLESSYVYDVADDTLCISLAEEPYTRFAGISVGGKLLSVDVFERVSGEIRINGQYLFDNFALNEPFALRVLTVGGYAQSQLVVEDNKAVAYDDSALTAFAKAYYACGVAHTFPQIKLTNDRQTATPVYTLVRGGAETPIVGNTVSFEKDGAYQLKVTVRGESKSYDVETYYDLGLVQGASIGTSGLSNDLIDGNKYDLQSYTITQNGKVVLSYKHGFDSWETFNEKVPQLNKRFKYQLQVAVTDKESLETKTQSAWFTVLASDAKSVLSTLEELANGNMKPYDTAKQALTYTSGNIGGRYGAIQWQALTNGINEATCIQFGDTFVPEMKAGTYVTFDLYADEVFSPSFWMVNTDYKLLYNEVGQLNENVRLYDENGERITQGGLWNGSFKGQWITIEVRLTSDMASDTVYAGLRSENNPMNEKEIYISNVKISASSFMGDKSDNSELLDGKIADGWNDYDELY